MAEAIADGAREAGAEVAIRHVPETVPSEVAAASHFKTPAHPEIESVEALADYDAVVVGTGTRYGRMSGQMAAFFDRAGGLWASGKMNGKVGAAFTSTGSQHGGQETTLFSIITNLLHFGLTIVGLDYGFQGQMNGEEIVGGAPYGATTIAGGRGERRPGEIDLAGARYLGARVARTAGKLFG